MIEFINVVKYYKNNKALNNVSFKIEENDFIILSGSNGSGKTTIINLINNVITLKNKDKGKIKRIKSISYFPEKIILPSLIKGLDFLKLFLDNYVSNAEIITYMEKYNVPNKDINLYSKGMTQKLMIIKTLLTPKELYIFDEPINGLDIETKKIFIADLKVLKKQKKTILVCSHEKELFGRLVSKEIKIQNGILCK